MTHTSNVEQMRKNGITYCRWGTRTRQELTVSSLRCWAINSLNIGATATTSFSVILCSGSQRFLLPCLGYVKYTPLEEPGDFRTFDV